MKILSVGLVAAFAAMLSPHRAHAAVGCTTPDKYHAVACFIDRSFDPTALCNDGTVPAFWYRPGSGSNMNRWIIWLQGGGSCDDQPSCSQRGTKVQAAQEMTSDGFAQTPGQGMISAKQSMNPTLYNANTVLVHYCSSDTWSGNRPATLPWDPTNAPAAWNFVGRRIAIAAIKSVLELVPQLNGANQIILGGDSSGAIGMVLLANEIMPLLPAAADKLLVNDGGFTLNIGQYDRVNTPAPFVYQGHPNDYETDILARFSFWAAHGESVCDQGATTTQQQSLCYDVAYVLQNGFIAVPTFVAISQIDTAQVTDQLCPQLYGFCSAPRTPTSPTGLYTTAFGQQMAAKVADAGAATYTGFAPNQYMHVILNLDSTYPQKMQFSGGTLSPRDAFDAWLANPRGAIVTNIGTGPGVN